DDGDMGQAGEHQITFSERSFAIDCASRPSSFSSTSSVCCPSNGGGMRTEHSVSENLNGMPSIFSAPMVGCSTVSTILRASVCGSARATATAVCCQQCTRG